MTKPSDIPEEVRAEAGEVWEELSHAFQSRDEETAIIARAIMAAEKRGMEREREAILQFEFDLPVYRNGADMMIATREYIRNRTP